MGEPPTSDSRVDAPGDGEDVYGRLATQARALTRSITGPSVPLTGEWQAGLGHLIRAVPRFPRPLERVVNPLDRLAELRLTPTEIGFDGRSVRWADVTGIQFGAVVDLLSTAVIEVELDRIVAALPPVPGRKWVSRKVLDSAQRHGVEPSWPAPPGRRPARIEAAAGALRQTVTARARDWRREPDDPDTTPATDRPGPASTEES